MEDLLEPSEETIAAAARAGAGFKGPDVTPALLLKEFYCALSENLQVMKPDWSKESSIFDITRPLFK